MSNYDSRGGQDQAHAVWRSGRPNGDVYASDPHVMPALYSGVLTKRFLAFLVDVVIISVPVVLATIFIALFAVVTLGLGWPLFWLISPASALWAIVYYGASLGGPHSATPGMRLLGIQMRTLSGAPGYFVLGAAHAVLFWVSVSFLTPFAVLFGMFNRRRRLLHDFVLGTVVVNERGDR